MHVKCPCAYGNCCQPLTMRRDFEGGVYWDKLADRCGNISRAVGFRGAARFWGNTVISGSANFVESQRKPSENFVTTIQPKGVALCKLWCNRYTLVFLYSMTSRFFHNRSTTTKNFRQTARARKLLESKTLSAGRQLAIVAWELQAMLLWRFGPYSSSKILHLYMCVLGINNYCGQLKYGRRA